MPGGDFAYNPISLKGNTAVEKLQYFLKNARASLKKLGLDSGSKVRFRGDVLEVSVDHSDLTPDQNKNANDSQIYIKTGLLISLLGKIISQAGLRPVVRTFPRFDEPELVGFVYIGDNMVSRRRVKSTGSKADILTRVDGYELSVAENIAGKQSLGISVVKDEDKLKIISTALRDGLECCKDSLLSDDLRTKIDDLINSELLMAGRSVIIVSSRQNTPTAWIGTGLFLGEMIEEMKELNKVVHPLSLRSCPSHFQSILQGITNGNTRHPQLVCMIDPVELQ